MLRDLRQYEPEKSEFRIFQREMKRLERSWNVEPEKYLIIPTYINTEDK